MKVDGFDTSKYGVVVPNLASADVVELFVKQ